jgi:hypothetical protein
VELELFDGPPLWLIFVLVVLGVFLVPYVLGPLLVFSTLKFRMPPEVVVIDPYKEPLPQEVRGYFAESYLALTQDGFELAGTMYLPGVVPNVRSLFALYANQATGEMAMTTLIVTTGGVMELKVRYVEFVTRYSDGVVVQTNNSPELGAFKPLPQEYTTQFWDVQDLHRLLALHRFLADKYRRAGHPVHRLKGEFQGNVVAYVARAVLEESFANQVETGYLTRTREGFRPSFKGAVIMAWQELPPIKPLRKWRKRRQAQAVLREFESRAGHKPPKV